jgi:threonine/homoserine/homoserine lactone efflux protein
VDPANLYLFIGASLVMLITPGPAVMYIVARSLEQGRKAGLLSVLGIQLGVVVHILAAALGLSTLMMTSALAYSAVKYAGAAYLVYLGISKLLQRDVAVAATEATGATGTASAAPAELSRVFWQGTVVAILNPKTALFFLAFLPQIVNPANGWVTGQIIGLGLLFAFMATITDGTWALVAGSSRGLLLNSPRYVRSERYVAGSVLIGLGLTAAFSGSRNGK